MNNAVTDCSRLTRKIKNDYAYAYFDECIYSRRKNALANDSYANQIVAISIFERSLQNVRSVSATLMQRYSANKITDQNGRTVELRNVYELKSFNSVVSAGSERFYHGLLYSSTVNNTDSDVQSIDFISYPEEAGNKFFELIQYKIKVPMLKWWAPFLFEAFKERGEVRESTLHYIAGAYATGKLKDGFAEGAELYSISCYALEATTVRIIKELFAAGKIWISKKKQNEITAENLDEYLQLYGDSIVSNLQKVVHPAHPLDGEAHNFCLNKKTLFPQQLSVTNAVSNLLRRSNYGLIVGEMGVGKTVIGVGVGEDYPIAAYRRRHPEKSLADVYRDKDCVKYRHIVMCPPQLVDKWANEIRSQVPHSKVTALSDYARDFPKLVALQRRGRERTGKEWIVMSRDFSKLSYMQMPAVTRVQNVKFGEMVHHDICICPNCGKPLTCIKKGEGEYLMSPEDLALANSGNSVCRACGESLWQPYVRNLGEEKKKRKWYRVTCYKNAKKVQKETYWVMDGYENRLYASLRKEPIAEYREKDGVRKVAPSFFVKKKMKGFFDLCFFDEVHELKNGDTAQGNAMAALVSASKKSVLLTGTLTGGKAQDIFYLIFRVDPRRMVTKGYKWTSALDFSEMYGCVETAYEADSVPEDYYETNKMSKGKKLSQPRVKPGISPRLFVDFLMDKAVFLNMADMSEHLPEFKEIPIRVPFNSKDDEGTMAREYQLNCNMLLDEAKTKDGFCLFGATQQFALSYPDKPYGRSPIIHPNSGCIVTRPRNFPQFSATDLLLSKERELIEILRKELEEGRDAFVYCEFSDKEETNIMGRLKTLIEEELHTNVGILNSTDVVAAKREKWIHEQTAKNDIHVWISNPRCVATGLDFLWEYSGELFNFPTIIFYQIGTSLFTVSQASRRSYRLIQYMACRVYYMYWEGTSQEKMVELIAEKQMAASALQGKFSAQGLAAMSQSGSNDRMKLARLLSQNSGDGGAKMNQMFDAVNALRNRKDDEESEYLRFKKMLTFPELTGLSLEEGIGEFVGDEIVPIKHKVSVHVNDSLLESSLFDNSDFAKVVIDEPIEVPFEEVKEESGSEGSFFDDWLDDEDDEMLSNGSVVISASAVKSVSTPKPDEAALVMASMEMAIKSKRRNSKKVFGEDCGMSSLF